MRTKTLLLAAALGAAGIASSMAQSVYSVNAVGYINLEIKPGYNLIANQLNGTNNLVSTVFQGVPDQSQFFKWDATVQTFTDYDTFYAGMGWLDSGFNPSTTTFNPGEAGFFSNPGATFTLTLVGEVPQGTNLTVTIKPNYATMSSIVPQSTGLAAMGFPQVDQMQYFTWNPLTQTYTDSLTYFEGMGWLDSGFNPVEPTPAVGQGFFVSNPGSQVSWTRSFTVN